MLETERLILRDFEGADFEDLYAYLSDAETLRFEPYPPQTEDQVRAMLKERIGSDEWVAVVRKSDSRLIGHIYFGNREFGARELGYVMNRAYWRQGYASEACTALLKRAFECGLHRAYAECDPINTASWRLLERCGFRREAHLKKNIYFQTDENGRPVWKDTYIYAKLNPVEE